MENFSSFVNRDACRVREKERYGFVKYQSQSNMYKSGQEIMKIQNLEGTILN